jgi:hypothetical protein
MTMKTNKRAMAVCAVAVLLVTLHGPGAQAQQGGGYDMTWNNTEGAVNTSSGGGYELAGAAGQPDAGAMSAGGYTLNGGFYVPPAFLTYLPIVRRS